MKLSKKHIVYTLGINNQISESSHLDESLMLKILHEQLLYETFLDSIKKYAGEKYNQITDKFNEWKDMASVLGKVLSNSNLLNDFLKPLQRIVDNLVKPLTDFLEKIKLKSFIEPIKKFITKISSLEGWKKFMALVSIGSIITYILEKLKSAAPETVKNLLVKTFSPDFINNILEKLTDFTSYVGWLQPIVKGVENIYIFLKPLIQRFDTALKSGSKFATKLIKENNMDKIKKLIKEALNEAPIFPVSPQTNTPSDVKGLDKAQSSSSTIKSKAKAINSVGELPGAFENWFQTLGFQPQTGTENGKTKLNKSQIIQALTKSLNNLGYK